MGKVMSCVFTLSMCAQPVGQVVYGALFDCFPTASIGCSSPPVCSPAAYAVASRVFEKDGGGRVKQKGHLQKQMSFFLMVETIGIEPTTF